ncbi:MAG: RdgB/HAM1 family non-canonical purine NTP pyrophosphatase [Dictyoglomus sp.]|nr:RdgB/HAM1 family non-canonical purine NTP pyrophosphatase [Dictyoglomus sp.]MDW8188162.1 RdgB/HAM1 family non-canonical purine NTP pyrophosphatase [Dictyoglomus sp.]
MKKIILATLNENKIKEIKEILPDLKDFFVSPQEFSIFSFPEETGKDYKENAYIKALFVCEKTNLPSIGEDSGLEIDFLGGAPGIYSARFGGNISFSEKMKIILEKMKNVPWEERTAEFVCTLAIVLPEKKKEPIFIEGRVKGYIYWEPKGDNGFGYDPIFYYPEYKCTFGELTLQEKNKISHRAKAFLKAGDILKKIVKGEI